MMKPAAQAKNKAKCKAYADYHVREKNKELKQARHLQKMEKLKARTAKKREESK